MGREILEEAVAVGEAVGHVLLATASADGVPHLASAGKLTVAGQGQVVVAEWFCPGAMENLQQNKRVTIVAWDAEADRGHQLVGRVVERREGAVVDGFAEELREEGPPQVEQELVIRVDEILRFSQGPHTDEPEWSGSVRSSV